MDPPGNINVVRSYGADHVRVGEHTYRRCCVLSPEAVLSDWPPDSFDRIGDADWPRVLALRPQVILIGAAVPPRAPAPLRRWLAEQNIGLEVMELGAACRTYNVLAQEGRRVVAVLFPAPLAG